MKKAVCSFPPLLAAVAAALCLFTVTPDSPAQGNEKAAESAGNQKANENTAVPSGMVRRELKLGFANVESLKEMLPDLMSPDGKFVILELSRVIRITDRVQNIETIQEIIKTLSVPPKNVRIEVTAMSIGTQNRTGVQVNGKGLPPQRNGRVQGGFITNNPQPFNTPGVTRQTTINGRPVQGPVQNNSGRIIMPKGGIDIGIGGISQRGSTATLNQQFILVQSGKTGSLEVVREVPMVDFFTRHFAGNTGFIIRGPGNVVQNIVQGGTFEVPEFRWEKAGAQLLVRPTVHGNLITVEVMPQISAIVVANPQKLRDRRINTHLTGADQYVQYTRLKTSVTVANGATVAIGGFTNAPPEFNRHFFGYGRSTSGGAGSITLKATIVEAQQPGRQPVR